MDDAKGLIALLTISKEMLSACERDDWPQVTALEQQRATLLKQHFDENALQTTSLQISADLKNLIVINQAIQSKSEAERQNILCQLGNLKRINKVVDAYAID